MDPRPYLTTDRDACLAIYDSNAASSDDRKKFETFLSNPEGYGTERRRRVLDAVGSLNQAHLTDVGDPEITTRISTSGNPAPGGFAQAGRRLCIRLRFDDASFFAAGGAGSRARV